MLFARSPSNFPTVRPLSTHLAHFFQRSDQIAICPPMTMRIATTQLPEVGAT